MDFDDFGDDLGDDGSEAITATEAAAFPLAGRAFLHQQGRTMTRGRVLSLTLDAAHWTLALALADVEYFDKAARSWRLRRIADAYGGALAYGGFYRFPDGRLQISGYGDVTHIAPAAETLGLPPGDHRLLWRGYPWPATDYHPGGPLAA